MKKENNIIFLTKNVDICKDTHAVVREECGGKTKACNHRVARGKCPGGSTPRKIGWGVRPAFQNPYPIYDQDLRYSLPYLRPDQKFETLFMT